MFSRALLLLIGRNAHPCALKEVKVMPVIYQSNEYAYIMQELTNDWSIYHFVVGSMEPCHKVGLPENCITALL